MAIYELEKSQGRALPKEADQPRVVIKEEEEVLNIINNGKFVFETRPLKSRLGKLKIEVTNKKGETRAKGVATFVYQESGNGDGHNGNSRSNGGGKEAKRNIFGRMNRNNKEPVLRLNKEEGKQLARVTGYLAGVEPGKADSSAIIFESPKVEERVRVPMHEPANPRIQRLKELRAKIKEGAVSAVEEVEGQLEEEKVKSVFASYLQVMESLDLVNVLDSFVELSKLSDGRLNSVEPDGSKPILAKSVVEPVANIEGYPVPFRFIGSLTEGRLKRISDLTRSSNGNGQENSAPSNMEINADYLAVSLRSGFNEESYNYVLLRLNMLTDGKYALEVFIGQQAVNNPNNNLSSGRDPYGTYLRYEASGTSVFIIEFTPEFWDKISQQKIDSEDLARIREKTGEATARAYLNYVEKRPLTGGLKEFFEEDWKIEQEEGISYRIGWQN